MSALTILHSVSIVIILMCLSAQLDQVETRSNKRGLITLDENSWIQMMKGEWMVAFHAPWCPACKKLEPEWRKFADWSDDLDVNVASADITTNPALNGRFMVKGLPTIYHVKDGVFRIYSGPRQQTALVNFIEDQGWKSIEPQSRFWNPDTLQMTFAAYSFKISMTLRDVHDYLVDEVGLPYYVSYSLFALGTFTLGIVISLIIVFIIDQFCPSRYSGLDVKQAALKATKKKTDKISDSDLDDQSGTDSKATDKTTSERLRKRAK